MNEEIKQQDVSDVKSEGFKLDADSQEYIQVTEEQAQIQEIIARAQNKKNESPRSEEFVLPSDSEEERSREIKIVELTVEEKEAQAEAERVKEVTRKVQEQLMELSTQINEANIPQESKDQLLLEMNQGITDLNSQGTTKNVAQNYTLLYDISLTAFESVKDNYREKLQRQQTKEAKLFEAENKEQS